jgi:ABC-type polysaccharide/polyol phosphate export permease
MTPWSPSYWFLLWELTRTEFKLRDQGTVLGFLWTLLHPILMFTVLYLLFISWFDRFVEQYAAYLIVGLVQWQFFEKATALALTSLRRKDGLIRNFKFPLELIVFSSVGSVLVSYLLETAVLLGFLLCLGLRPAAGWVLLPAVVLAHLAFTLGVSLILALCAVEFQDLDRIWGVLTTAGFYVTPVFYPMRLISERYGRVMALNPLLHILGAFRACLVPGQPLRADGLLWVVPLSVVLCAAGVAAFRRGSYWIADRVFAL